MKAVFFAALCCLLGVALAQSFEGTWNDGKRNFGGDMFVCVDQDRNVATGSYSGVGLFSGLIRGNTLNGQWYEGGYDRPFGPFTLTLAADGNSFTGTWSYIDALSNATAVDFTWTGTRSSRLTPDVEQCLTPSRGIPADGTYDGGVICNRLDSEDENSGEPAVFARFSGFGAVEGYSSDAGRISFMSDYIVRDGEADLYRPENNVAVFGPCVDCNQFQNTTEITTSRIVIGAVVDDGRFCGFFWTGFYNTRVAEEAICFERDSFLPASDGDCAIGSIQTTAGGGLAATEQGNTELLLEEIQGAFDGLALPPVVIVQGDIVDDDDDGIDNNGVTGDTSLFTTGGNPITSLFSSVSGTGSVQTSDIIYVPVLVPNPIPVPFPVPNPIPVPVPVIIPVGTGTSSLPTSIFGSSFTSFFGSGSGDSSSGASFLMISFASVLIAALI